MTRNRVLLLLGIVAAGAVAAWRIGVEMRGPEAVLAPAAVGRPAGIWQTHPAAHRWAADACLEIAAWGRVAELPDQIAVFETVFWEPQDTASLRARLADRSEVEGKTVLEIGTGSGLLALCCLSRDARKVVATDVNPSALCNALYNADNLGLADRLELRRVPLDSPGAFSVIGDAEKFDLILSNPPWEDDLPQSIGDYAYYDPGFELLRSLLEGLADHLEPGGKALLAYGSREAIRSVIRLAPDYSLEVQVLDERDPEKMPDVFLPGMLLEVAPAAPPPQETER